VGTNETICIPTLLLPNPEVASCNWTVTWEDLSVLPEDKNFTGGLGKLMVPYYLEAWVCSQQHPCLMSNQDEICFIFNEKTSVFHPWGWRSQVLDA